MAARKQKALLKKSILQSLFTPSKDCLGLEPSLVKTFLLSFSALAGIFHLGFCYLLSSIRTTCLDTPDFADALGEYRDKRFSAYLPRQGIRMLDDAVLGLKALLSLSNAPKNRPIIHPNLGSNESEFFEIERLSQSD